MVKRSTLAKMPIKRKSKKAKVSAATKFQNTRLSNRLLLGPSRTVDLSYVDYFSIDGGAVGTPATYIFSCNGLFDPNITGVGHQPRGYDQLKSLYDHYQVTKATLKVTFLSPGDQTSSFGYVIGVLISDDTTVETDQIHALENRKSAWAMIPSNEATRTLYLDFDAKEFFGGNWRGDDYKGSINANPSDQAYFQIFCQTTAAVDSAALACCVEILYTAKFTEPNNVQIS